MSIKKYISNGFPDVALCPFIVVQKAEYIEEKLCYEIYLEKTDLRVFFFFLGGGADDFPKHLVVGGQAGVPVAFGIIQFLLERVINVVEYKNAIYISFVRSMDGLGTALRVFSFVPTRAPPAARGVISGDRLSELLRIFLIDFHRVSPM